ncbi:MAG: hypothetical protein Fur0041_04830 [Bacteroidia bacterium]
MKKALAIIFGVLFIDQFVKIWIKTHMYLGESYRVTGEWFYLHFVENPGMAFGLELGGNYGKLMLSVFRMIAVAGIGYYLWTLFKKQVRPLLIVCVALIFAGALGNILDSVFYGIMFNGSDPWEQNVAQLFPENGGYAGWLHGQVVDMFYFPVLRGTFPENFPIWGGEPYEFFRPVFNIADAAISVGVFLLIVFQRRLFGENIRIDEKKIMLSNVFFTALVLILSLFVFLTFAALFANEHPLNMMMLSAVVMLSAGISAAFFFMMKKYPVYQPPLPIADPATVSEEEDGTQTESKSEDKPKELE